MRSVTKRNCPGSYTIEHKVDEADYYTVEIVHRPELKGWIAAAQWDRHLYTDPVASLRKAKREAATMIDTAINERVRRLVKDNEARLRALDVAVPQTLKRVEA